MDRHPCSDRFSLIKDVYGPIAHSLLKVTERAVIKNANEIDRKSRFNAATSVLGHNYLGVGGSL